jgi:hypothetical protein
MPRVLGPGFQGAISDAGDVRCQFRDSRRGESSRPENRALGTGRFVAAAGHLGTSGPDFSRGPIR